jgi:hypothetical protein
MILAYDNSYYIQNQPSVAAQLLKNISDSYAKFLQKREFEKAIDQVHEKVLTITSKAHKYNAKIESIRDFVDLYHINDIETEEELFNNFFNLIEEKISSVEEILDTIEALEIPKEVKTHIFDAYDELYDTMVNVNFAITQKIAQAYLVNESNTELLQEA